MLLIHSSARRRREEMHAREIGQILIPYDERGELIAEVFRVISIEERQRYMRKMGE